MQNLVCVTGFGERVLREEGEVGVAESIDDQLQENECVAKKA